MRGGILAPAGQRTWWKDATIYQIYPASFSDSNGDGYGDLPGIIAKLDYIQSLGVDALWICPMYDSPMFDMGYDIRDYEKVYPPFGTNEDMELLIREAHARGLKVLLDLVINHTSDQHKWFQEARKSRDNPYRDWYIWRDAKYDADGNRMPPNNWRSFFSKPAWTWDEHTQQYYLHLFCKEQPDLNWENDTTRKAIFDTAIHFWLSRGIDGFRVDTVNFYSKGTQLLDAPVTDKTRYDQFAAVMFCHGPRIHEFLREINKALAMYNTPEREVMTVGELPHIHTKEDVLSFVSASDPQLSMTFLFDVVDVGQGGAVDLPRFDYQGFKLSEYKAIWGKIQSFLANTDGWASAFLENHDQARSVSRFANDSPQWRAHSAKLLATQLATAGGTLFLYQGQEIGTINIPDSWPLERYTDVDSVNYVATESAKDSSKERRDQMRANLRILARDNARLPMQWSASENGGFSPAGSSAKTWMPVHDAASSINVAAQQDDPSSPLNYWRRALKLRKANIDLFAHGEFVALDAENEKTFCFCKVFGEKRALISLNFSDKDQDDCSSLVKASKGFECVMSSYEISEEACSDIKAGRKLRPYEGRVYLVL